jgi:hypothetical protein
MSANERPIIRDFAASELVKVVKAELHAGRIHPLAMVQVAVLISIYEGAVDAPAEQARVQ